MVPWAVSFAKLMRHVLRLGKTPKRQPDGRHRDYNSDDLTDGGGTTKEVALRNEETLEIFSLVGELHAVRL